MNHLGITPGMKERLKLKRKDLAIELRCIVCKHRVTLPVDHVLISGAMPMCQKCTAPMAVERAVPRKGVL